MSAILELQSLLRESTLETHEARTESAKWERLYDAVYDALSDEIKRDSFGELEELHETAARVLAEVREWRRLRDPATLHVNLLRGVPCVLPAHLLLHIAGDDAQTSVAERDRMKAAICAHVNACCNDDTAGDTWGELLRVVGYDCE